MSRVVARYVGKLASGKRVYVNAYDAKPLAFAVYLTRHEHKTVLRAGEYVPTDERKTELVGKVENREYHEELRFNPETRCYERKPDGTPHVMTAREYADEHAGWFGRHGSRVELVEVVELALVRPRGAS